jgi:hypothetical protein
MIHQPKTPTPRARKVEAVTPVIERTLNELLLLVAQLFVTPLSVLFNTRSFRDRLTELADDSGESKSPNLVARPVLFYLIWAAVYFALSGLYFKALSRDLLSRISWIDIFGQGEWVTSPGAKGLALFSELSRAIGQSQAIVVVAFGLLLIIAAKAFLICLAGRILNSQIRFNTALQASAYAFGTFLFAQYVFLLFYICLSMMFGWPGAWAGFYILAYGTIAVSITLVVRTNQIIRLLDDINEVWTFASWFLGALAWHLAVMYLSLTVLKQMIPNLSFTKIWIAFLMNLVGLTPNLS